MSLDSLHLKIINQKPSDFSPKGFVRFSKCIFQNLKGANRNIKNKNNLEYWLKIKKICLDYIELIPYQANVFLNEIDLEDENTNIAIIETISMANLILSEEVEEPVNEVDITLTYEQVQAFLKI